jgi:hypothetical protein
VFSQHTPIWLHLFISIHLQPHISCDPRLASLLYLLLDGEYRRWSGLAGWPYDFVPFMHDDQ